MSIRAGFATVLVGLLASMAGQGEERVDRLVVPAGPESGIYSLATDGRDGALLSWLEPSARGAALKFSSLVNGRWSAARTIVEGKQLFSNWADHPSIAAQPDGTLLAQWPVVNDGPQPAGSYNNSMRIAISRDGGTTWKEVFADGLDNTVSYTGFVSILPSATGARAVYLSPPRPISNDLADHRMTLSHVAFDASGARASSGVVDTDTCSCCPTAMGITTAGPIAAYRDHEPGEIRDIAVVRLVNGAWSAPTPVHRDGWVINGCPTNGPAIGASGTRVAIAWFTAADNTPAVKVAFSNDSGVTFSGPTTLDGKNAVGRPAALMLADGTAVVAWLASIGDGSGRGELRLRRVAPDGAVGPIVLAGEASPGRLSGMPQIVQVKERLLVAWRADTLKTVLLPTPPR